MRFLGWVTRKMQFEHWIVLGFTFIGIANIIGDRPGLEARTIATWSGWYLVIGGMVVIASIPYPTIPRWVQTTAWVLMAAGALAAGIVTVVWYFYIPVVIAFILKALSFRSIDQKVVLDAIRDHTDGN